MKKSGKKHEKKNKGKILARLSKGRNERARRKKKGNLGGGNIKRREKTQGENERKRKTKYKGG